MPSSDASPSRLPGAAATAAGALWLVVWLHGLRAHGGTQENEMREFAGLTWMDSGKFLVLPFLLLIPAFLELGGRAGRRRPGKAALLVGRAAALVLAVAAVGTAIEFWTFEWGSYEETFESKDGVSRVPVQPLASLVLAILTGALGVIAVRARAAPVWLAALLVVGALATLFLTPANFVPGVVWLAFGLWLFLGRVEDTAP